MRLHNSGPLEGEKQREAQSQGCCVVTGTAFELPMVIQVDRLPTDKQPASEDVDLEKLWSDEAPAV